MRKKTLIVLGVFLAFFVIQGCTSAPEKTLLKKYFNAVTMNDNDTMSSGEEKVEPASLPQMNTAEIEAKKAQDAQIGPTIDADTAVKDAQFEMDTTRSASAKAALKRQVDELQAKYDTENAKMQELKRVYNAAKSAAAAEEEMTMFSLGARELPVVRQLVGDVHSKTVEIAVTNRAGATRNYRVVMKQYLLRDEANKIPHRGRWIFIRFEPLA
ncbi:MAG: hypothetical protein MUE80_04670 [Acidobacteria bacterium]|nr:hypothetical protein [Acidobacteriota bacterium]